MPLIKMLTVKYDCSNVQLFTFAVAHQSNISECISWLTSHLLSGFGNSMLLLLFSEVPWLYLCLDWLLFSEIVNQLNALSSLDEDPDDCIKQAHMPSARSASSSEGLSFTPAASVACFLWLALLWLSAELSVLSLSKFLNVLCGNL